MANYIRKNTRAALFASASAFLALLSGETAHAQNVNFYCGNVEFQLDTARSTITNRFLSNEPVQWQYDGEWLRWTVTRSNEAFGVNVLNGYFISGGQSADAGCQIENSALLASIPLSEGAALRRVFVDLPPDVRRSVQDHLRFRGLYNSTIDGLWGRGTQAALLAYAASLPQEYFAQGDYRSEVGARIVFDQINLAIMEGDVSTPLVDNQGGLEITTSEDPNIAAPNISGTVSSDCINTLNLAYETIRYQDRNTRLETWQILGIFPTWIDPNRDHIGSLLERPMSNQIANEICTTISRVEDRFIGFERVARNGSEEIRYVSCYTTEIERARLTGEWALLRGRVDRSRYGTDGSQTLPTRAVSFTLHTNRRGETRCHVNFFVFPYTATRFWFTGNEFPLVNEGRVRFYVDMIFGQPFISLEATDGTDRSSYFMWTNPAFLYGANGDMNSIFSVDLSASDPRFRGMSVPVYSPTQAIASAGWVQFSEVLNGNYSAFSDELNFDGAVESLRRLGQSLGFAEYSIAEAPSRDQSPVVNSPECVAALNQARERYAQRSAAFRR